MALRHHGLEGYRKSIERDVALAEGLAASLRASDDFELFEPTSLSIVCFRYSPANAARQDESLLDSLNKAILERVQLGGRVFLSSTVINNRFWLRACVINPRARENDVQTIIPVIREAAQPDGR